MSAEKMLWVLCAQVAGDERSERFILVAADLSRPGKDFVRASLPLVEIDIRDELAKAGLRSDQIDDHIQKARAFKTTTTTNDWWPVMFGARRP
jgi:hypothetical protein